tara:strand:- start:1325 stop:1471 length:147 start_codon:yes stop_codon:yes gene_type:complete
MSAINTMTSSILDLLMASAHLFGILGFGGVCPLFGVGLLMPMQLKFFS